MINNEIFVLFLNQPSVPGSSLQTQKLKQQFFFLTKIKFSFISFQNIIRHIFVHWIILIMIFFHLKIEYFKNVFFSPIWDEIDMKRK